MKQNQCIKFIWYHLNTLRPRQNARHFPDDIFKCIFLNKNEWILLTISLKFVPKGPIINIPALVQIMAWRRPGDRPLFEPMMFSQPTHICIIRPQWVNIGLMTLSYVLLMWLTLISEIVCNIFALVLLVKSSCEKLFSRPSINCSLQGSFDHDVIIKWKRLSRYWPFVQRIRRSLVNSPLKGQWRGALMFSLICAWIKGWVNTRKAGDLRRHRAHYDITLLLW